MSGFWAMGGYAAYVWPAYAISIGALAIAAAVVFRAYASAKAVLAALEKP
jgi:heme exporter protein CcmD